MPRIVLFEFRGGFGFDEAVDVKPVVGQGRDTGVQGTAVAVHFHGRAETLSGALYGLRVEIPARLEEVEFKKRV